MALVELGTLGLGQALDVTQPRLCFAGEAGGIVTRPQTAHREQLL